MTDLLLVLVAPLALLLMMAVGGLSSAAEPTEEDARKSLRSALGGLVSCGLPKARIARMAADELDDLRLLTKGAR